MLLTITGFLGRFHPLVVHLPIGFIIIAVLLEWKFRNSEYQKSISYIWLMSGISAAIASIMGWFLANEGSYANWTLFFHRWMGIGIAIVSFLAWHFRKRSSSSPLKKKATNIVAIILLTVTGHLGGNMTHGEDYLYELAPAPIKNLFMKNKGGDAIKTFDNPDSVYVYNDLIFPVLETKCAKCHDNDVQNGGLNLATVEGLKAGGDTGPSIIAEDLNSELLLRVTLPASHSKFMPTSGTPMTFHEVKLLEWWIASGANYNNLLSEYHVDKKTQSSLLKLHKLDMTPRPWIEKNIAPFIDSSSLTNLKATNLMITQISSDNGWIEVAVPFGSAVDKEQVDQLLPYSEQITWLSLGNATLNDAILLPINTLTNLTKLKLQKNDITSQGLNALTDLEQLEVLNITETNVDDQFLSQLGDFPALKNLYVWGSKISDEGIERARKQFPNINIISGSNN